MSIKIMKYIIQVFIIIRTIYCTEYHEFFKVSNQTLYNEVVDYFFPKELQNLKFENDSCLCFLKAHICCSCKGTCRYYGTCCVDTFFNKDIISVQEYVDIFFNMIEIRKYVKTLPVINFGNTTFKFNVEKLPMVASCENRQSYYANLCNTRDSKNDIRVIANGFLYKNKYCALCHGFEMYTFGSIELVSDSVSFNAAGKPKLDNCFTLRMIEDNRLGYIKEKANHVSCSPTKLSKLNCSKRDTDICFRSNYTVIKTSKMQHSNPYCAVCNNETGLENIVCPGRTTKKYEDFYPPNRIPGRCLVFIGNSPGLFRLIISFDEHGEFDSRLDSGQPLCFANQYYDIFSNQCKNKPEYINPKIINGNPEQTAQLPLLSELKKTYQCIHHMGGIAIRKESTNKNLTRNEANKINFCQNHTEAVVKYKNYSKLLDSVLYNKSIYLILVPYQICPYSELYGFSPKHYFLYNRVCADPEMITQKFEITKDCNINVNSTVYKITEDVVYWITITEGNISHAAAQCKRFHLASKCTLGLFNTSLTKMINKSVAVSFDDGKKTYSPEQYLPLPEGLGICLGNENVGIKEYQWLRRYYYFENILVLTALSVSIILELLLLLYLNRKTRTIAERNLTSFSFNLLLCDFTVFISYLLKRNINGTPCKIIAVMIHFFSLALCTWSCVIAYDIWYIFRSRNTGQRLSNLCFRYSIVAWGAPILITLICVNVDFLSAKSIIGYREHGYCWISSLHARLILYIIPFSAMTFGSSLIVFISMLQQKHERREIHKNIARGSQISYPKILIKLFLLLGTVELIGLIQIPSVEQKGQFEVILHVTFGLLYTFLRSSRGIFMFALFGWNGIRKKYRKHVNIPIPLTKIESINKLVD